MKRLNCDALKVGDVILATTTGKVSKGIRVGTGSDISHAMIYVADHSVIDATREGVHARNTQRVFFEDHIPIYVYRLRNGLESRQAQELCNFARSEVGVQYSTIEAMRAVVRSKRRPNRKQFCSRLVAQSYASVGIALVDDPHFCSPADLKRSTLLVEVANPTCPVSDDEEARMMRHLDLTQLTRAAINIVLDGAREKNNSIQNFADLNRHLIDHPGDDAEICRLLRSSGYLTLWQVEMERNPWQYDLGLLQEMPFDESEIAHYCRELLRDESASPNRFVVNRGQYSALTRDFGFQAFAMLRDVYETIAQLHLRRVEVATKWLEMKNLSQVFTSQSHAQPTPHTDEWFTALAAWDPHQAAATQTIISLAGRLEVCSICGDDPARDYQLTSRTAGVNTLRLCDDCVKIRETMGDYFTPLSDGGIA